METAVVLSLWELGATVKGTLAFTLAMKAPGLSAPGSASRMIARAWNR